MIPLLMPCPPALLRPGLVLADGAIVTCVYVDGVTPTTGGSCVMVVADDGVEDPRDVGGISIDLRDPSVRDALLREVLRKLRPDAPEQFGAPALEPAENGADWILFFKDGAFLDLNAEIMFSAQADDEDDETVHVPGLPADGQLDALRMIANMVLS